MRGCGDGWLDWLVMCRNKKRRVDVDLSFLWFLISLFLSSA
jgi:hypothetical protein